jgi:hypothetical protein
VKRHSERHKQALDDLYSSNPKQTCHDEMPTRVDMVLYTDATSVRASNNDAVHVLGLGGVSERGWRVHCAS